MSLRQPCRDWKAGGSCRFALRCRFQHDGIDAERAEDVPQKQSNIAASNVSTPLTISASGSTICLAPLSALDCTRWLETKSGRFREEFDRRFVLALLRPLFPHLADALLENFTPYYGAHSRFFSDYYNVAQHLKSAQGVRGLLTPKAGAAHRALSCFAHPCILGHAAAKLFRRPTALLWRGSSQNSAQRHRHVLVHPSLTRFGICSSGEDVPHRTQSMFRTKRFLGERAV